MFRLSATFSATYSEGKFKKKAWRKLKIYVEVWLGSLRIEASREIQT
jgi:hypothetical protein